MKDGFLADLACFVGNPGIICFFTILVPSQFLCYEINLYLRHVETVICAMTNVPFCLLE